MTKYNGIIDCILIAILTFFLTRSFRRRRLVSRKCRHGIEQSRLP